MRKARLFRAGAVGAGPEERPSGLLAPTAPAGNPSLPAWRGLTRCAGPAAAHARAAISGTTSTSSVVTFAALDANTRETSSQLTGASSSFQES